MIKVNWFSRILHNNFLPKKKNTSTEQKPNENFGAVKKIEPPPLLTSSFLPPKAERGTLALINEGQSERKTLEQISPTEFFISSWFNGAFPEDIMRNPTLKQERLELYRSLVSMSAEDSLREIIRCGHPLLLASEIVDLLAYGGETDRYSELLWASVATLAQYLNHPENPKALQARQTLIQLAFRDMNLLDFYFTSLCFPQQPIDSLLNLFASERSFKVGEVSNELSIAELKAIAFLPYETTFFKAFDRYWLLRGTEGSTLKLGEFIFHNHPGDNPDHIFPSAFDFSIPELSLLLSQRGLLIFNHDRHYSWDSFHPFTRKILNALSQGAKVVAGQLNFRANWANRKITLLFFPWETLETAFWSQHKLQLLPEKIEVQTGPDTENLPVPINLSLPTDRFPKVREEYGSTYHPELGHKTGNYFLKFWK